MDSLTQIVLGASVGEVVMGKEAGNRAILWGAVAGTIPDLDIIPGQFMDTVSRLEFHRGFSHSIVFFLLLTPLLGWVINAIYRKKIGSHLQGWMALVFWCTLTHALLDCFTTWGTKLFWPLDHRVAIHSIHVVDPLYTVPFLILVAVLMFLRKESSVRRWLNYSALLYSTLYLGVAFFNQYIARERLVRDFNRERIAEIDSIIVKPTPANSILWSGTVLANDTLYIAYHSLLDPDEEITWEKFPKRKQLYEKWEEVEVVERMADISEGFFSVSQRNDTLIFKDLRFGQIEGWRDKKSEFVFTYNIFAEGDEWVVQQRENSFKDLGLMAESLWNEITGK